MRINNLTTEKQAKNKNETGTNLTLGMVKPVKTFKISVVNAQNKINLSSKLLPFKSFKRIQIQK